MMQLKKLRNKFSNKYIKAGIGYATGNIFLKCISLISFPLFAHLLSTAEFGKFNNFMALERIMYIFCGCAIHVSIRNARIEKKEEYDLFCSNLLLFILINSLILILIFNFINPFTTTIDLSGFELNLLLFCSFSTALVNFYQTFLSMDYKYKEFVSLSIISAILNITIALYLIQMIRIDGYTAKILALAISNVPLLFIVTKKFLFSGFFKIKLSYLKYGLKISIPIIPHALSQIVLSSFDSIMINRMVGFEEAGIYGISYTVANIILMLSTAIENVWTPWVFQAINENKIEIVKKISRRFVFFSTLFIAVLMMASPEVIKVLTAEAYWESQNFTMISLLGVYFSIIYVIPACIEYYHKKTYYIAASTAVAAGLNILLNYITIKKFGYSAAAYTTAITYFLYYIFHTIIANRILKLVDLKYQSKFFAYIIFVCFFCRMCLFLPIVRWLFALCNAALIIIEARKVVSEDNS